MTNTTPKIKTAGYAGAYKIRLTFGDGKCGVIDLEEQPWGEVFEPLRDAAQFKALRVDAELSMIVRPTGADLAPEFLYQARM